jgi:hypothetical protein
MLAGDIRNGVSPWRGGNARMKLAVGRRSISGTHDFLLFVLVKSMFIIINGRVSNT